MPLKIDLKPTCVFLLRFSGILKRSEFAGRQSVTARAIDVGMKPRILAILEKFEGWERGADWNDLDFLLTRGNETAKIAIAGEPCWETDALAFAGAGFRSAPVKFFPSDELAEARAWLTQE